MRVLTAMTRQWGWVRRVPALACAVATVALAAAACGGGDDELEEGSPRSPTTTAPVDPTTTTPPTTALAPEEEVEAVYLELVEAVDRILTTGPDPDDPNLARLATDPVLGSFRDNLTTMQAEHHIVRPGPRTSHRVMSVTLEEPDLAILRDCYVGNDTRIDQDDNSVVSEGLSTRVLEVTVVSLDESWVVSDITTLTKLEGEVPCPE
jgi:hypothetical protein